MEEIIDLEFKEFVEKFCEHEVYGVPVPLLKKGGYQYVLERDDYYTLYIHVSSLDGTKKYKKIVFTNLLTQIVTSEEFIQAFSEALDFFKIPYTCKM